MAGDRRPGSQAQRLPSTSARGRTSPFLTPKCTPPWRRAYPSIPHREGTGNSLWLPLLSVWSTRSLQVNTFPLATADDTTLMPLLASQARGLGERQGRVSRWGGCGIRPVEPGHGDAQRGAGGKAAGCDRARARARSWGGRWGAGEQREQRKQGSERLRAGRRKGVNTRHRRPRHGNTTGSGRARSPIWAQ